MRRGITGSYETASVGGEHVRAFIPHPLPPEPPLDLSNARQRLLERAALALGRLDNITLLLPDPNLFIYSYVRREAVLSSQIEGTQSSLSDLLLFELEEAPGAPPSRAISRRPRSTAASQRSRTAIPTRSKSAGGALLSISRTNERGDESLARPGAAADQHGGVGRRPRKILSDARVNED